MSECRSKLSRYNTISCQQVMPIPMIPVLALDYEKPVPISSVDLPFPPSNDTSVIIPSKIPIYPTPCIPAIGTILLNPTGMLPTGYLLCDGSEISRVTYDKLFAIIKTYYGCGDDVTTFNVPNISTKYNPNMMYIIKY
jgi:hypothetical protein